MTAAFPFSAVNDGAGMPIEFSESQLKFCDMKVVSQQTFLHLILQKKAMFLIKLDSCFVFFVIAAGSNILTSILGSYRNSKFQRDINTTVKRYD